MSEVIEVEEEVNPLNKLGNGVLNLLKTPDGIFLLLAGVGLFLKLNNLRYNKQTGDLTQIGNQAGKVNVKTTVTDFKRIERELPAVTTPLDRQQKQIDLWNRIQNSPIKDFITPSLGTLGVGGMIAKILQGVEKNITTSPDATTNGDNNILEIHRGLDIKFDIFPLELKLLGKTIIPKKFGEIYLSDVLIMLGFGGFLLKNLKGVIPQTSII
jgi:hypothetical protein